MLLLLPLPAARETQSRKVVLQVGLAPHSGQHEMILQHKSTVAAGLGCGTTIGTCGCKACCCVATCAGSCGRTCDAAAGAKHGGCCCACICSVRSGPLASVPPPLRHRRHPLRCMAGNPHGPGGACTGLHRNEQISGTVTRAAVLRPRSRRSRQAGGSTSVSCRSCEAAGQR